MKSLSALLLLAISFSSMGQEIFKITKNRRPKNVLNYTANVVDCKFKEPVIGVYWIIGEEDGRTEGLDRIERPSLTPKVNYVRGNEASFSLKALNRIEEQVPKKEILVRIENCKPVAYVEVNGEEIKLKEIFVNFNRLMSPIYMTVKGQRANGTPYSLKIQ